MNKYEKELIELREEYAEEYDDYKQKLSVQRNEAQKACSFYNGQIGVINSERHGLREELCSLYDFLKDLGNVGIPITVFDYVIEVPETISIEVADGTDIKEREREKRGIGDALTFVVSPAAFLAKQAFTGILKRKKDKEYLFEQKEVFEREKTKWANQIAESKRLVTFYKTAGEIADLYRSIVATVRDTVKKTIVPELDGIYAFLSAFAIKEAVIYGDDPDEAGNVKIEEISGTPYEQHYIFVKNTFEYYQLIKAFFTEPILTTIVSDRKITAQEEREFKKQIDTIKNQGKVLENSVSFGG